MLKQFATVVAVALPITAHAAQVDIEGNVQSKCIIQTDTTGVYGNPSPDKLSTLASDSGPRRAALAGTVRATASRCHPSGYHSGHGTTGHPGRGSG